MPAEPTTEPEPTEAPAGQPDAEERPRDRTFVQRAGASAAAMGGGMLVGGIVGGVAGVVAGIALALVIPFFFVIAAPVFAVLLGTVGLIGGGLIGGGVAFLGSLFFIPPTPPEYELPRNVITVAPGELVLRRFGFEYERQLNPHFTAFVAPLFENDTGVGYTWRGGTGPSVTAGVRAYLWGQAPRGAFIGLQLHGGVGTFQRSGTGLDVATYDNFGGVGVSFGHSWLLAKHFAVGYGLGATYQATHAVVPGSGARHLFHEVTPTLRLTLGGAF